LVGEGEGRVVGREGEGRRRRTGEARQRRFIDWEAEFGRGRVEDFLEGFFFGLCVGTLGGKGLRGVWRKPIEGFFCTLSPVVL